MTGNGMEKDRRAIPAVSQSVGNGVGVMDAPSARRTECVETSTPYKTGEPAVFVLSTISSARKKRLNCCLARHISIQHDSERSKGY